MENGDLNSDNFAKDNHGNSVKPQHTGLHNPKESSINRPTGVIIEQIMRLANKTFVCSDKDI